MSLPSPLHTLEVKSLMAGAGQFLHFPASIGKTQSCRRNQPASLRSFVNTSSVPKAVNQLVEMPPRSRPSSYALQGWQCCVDVDRLSFPISASTCKSMVYGHLRIGTVQEQSFTDGSGFEPPRNFAMNVIFAGITRKPNWRQSPHWPAPCVICCSCRSGAGACRDPAISYWLVSNRRSARCRPRYPTPRPSAGCRTSCGS